MKWKKELFLLPILIVITAVVTTTQTQGNATADVAVPVTESTDKATESAVLAGGCFWCVESDFEKLEGVHEVISGYSGGHLDNPTYKQVSAGGTGHIEVAKVIYDPQVISYTQILDFFWRHIDPTTDTGQFCDRGKQYRPAILYTESQKDLALASKASIEKHKPFADPIKVELLPAATFYPAEEYHQDYYKKNPLRYKYYRLSCGRDGRVGELWGQSEH